MRPSRLPLLAVLASTLIPLAACGGAADPSASATGGSAPPAEAAAPKEPSQADRLAAIDPKSPEMNREAPAEFRVKLETTKGDVVIEVTRAWSPNGADRFHNLVQAGFYDDCRIFRVMENFMCQMGLCAVPAVNSRLRAVPIADDPHGQSNTRGMVSFAKTNSPNSRTVQFFINYKDNSSLDRQDFTPFGRVVEGMDVADRFESKYGNARDMQGIMNRDGYEELDRRYPGLDSIVKATVLE